MFVPALRKASSRATALAISLAACYARLSRYGVIRIVVLLTCGQLPRPTLTGLRYRWTARLGRARASAILSDSERCREMSFILLNLQLSFPIVKKKCPNGANPSAFTDGCQLSSRARFLRRLPTALSFLGNPQWSIPRGGVRRYKPMLRIALPRSCPERLAAPKVPNRGVDWSSRPRRACYPWGNFSVTSSPQQ